MFLTYWSLSTGLSSDPYDWSAENAMALTTFSNSLSPTFSCEMKTKGRTGLNLVNYSFVFNVCFSAEQNDRVTFRFEFKYIWLSCSFCCMILGDNAYNTFKTELQILWVSRIMRSFNYVVNSLPESKLTPLTLVASFEGLLM